jgi:uncharacterized protein (UPF0210 family)
MKIRSITLFSAHDPRRAADPQLTLLYAAKELLQAAGYEVQTLRLALADPARLVPAALGESERRRQWLELGQALESLCPARVDYASIGALRATDELASEIPDLLANTEHVFAAASMSDAAGVDLASVFRLGQVVHANARLRDDGFANLRFAALSRVPPTVPFLPAAYHAGGEVRLAIAAECADLLLAACSGAASLPQARAAIVQAVQSHAMRIEAALASGLPAPAFAGLDFSPATFPGESCSLAAAIEALGVPRLGRHGSTAAAAFLASALDAAQFRRAGFNGLFFPVLEDSRLAQRAAEGELGLKDLLLWSTVCGTGLDTVPLPGDIGAGELAAILLDVAALGARLCKPLTARLMPMPQCAAGAKLRFDFPFFAPGQVLPHAASRLGGALAHSPHLAIDQRPIRSADGD